MLAEALPLLEEPAGAQVEGGVAASPKPMTTSSDELSTGALVGGGSSRPCPVTSRAWLHVDLPASASLTSDIH